MLFLVQNLEAMCLHPQDTSEINKQTRTFRLQVKLMTMANLWPSRDKKRNIYYYVFQHDVTESKLLMVFCIQSSRCVPGLHLWFIKRKRPGGGPSEQRGWQTANTNVVTYVLYTLAPPAPPHSHALGKDAWKGKNGTARGVLASFCHGSRGLSTVPFNPVWLHTDQEQAGIKTSEPTLIFKIKFELKGGDVYVLICV